MSAPTVTPPATWAAWDVNATTKAFVEGCLRATGTSSSGSSPTDALQPYFSSRLEFGTAGLRAEFGPGPNAMNELVCMQAAQGLVVALEDALGPDEARRRGVVVGYDHRRSVKWGSSSTSFALAVACAFLAKGHRVHLFEEVCPTPMVPFTIQRRLAAAGCMLTASHNPKDDAGFKVYWGNACQITSPVDDAIAKRILENLEPWPEAVRLFRAGETAIRDACKRSMGANAESDAAVRDAYVTAARARLCRRHEENGSFRGICYTPMHGVGSGLAHQMLEAFGFHHADIVQVREQAAADADFPTVKFPNPEEKGALDLALATAEANGKTLVLANDPDADRLAVAELSSPPLTDKEKKWTVFTGDEIAALLGWWELEHYHKGRSESMGPCMVVSAVSSRFLGAIAKKRGATVVETLTGFKWIGNRVAELREEGYEVLLSYEEAIGFCVGDVILDKDGLTALAVFAEMTAFLASKGQTCVGKLEELRKEVGYYFQRNHYLKTRDPAKMFAAIRANGRYPLLLGARNGAGKRAYRVVSVRDLAKGPAGVDTSRADQLPVLPRTSLMITFTLDADVVVTLRASGTEPKLKYYCEAFGTDPVEVRQRLDDVVERVVLGDLLREASSSGAGAVATKL